MTSATLPVPARRFSPLLLGLLLAVSLLVAVVGGVLGRGQPLTTTTVHGDFERILEALAAYHQAEQRYPEAAQDLSFLVPRYLPRLPLDPWGRPYHFATDGKRPFLATWGSEGLRGGNGSEEDHTQFDGHRTPSGARSPSQSAH